MRSSNQTPTVSIGLPVYNGAQFIKKAIDSILAQTYTDFELIIVDNSSTDDTVKICEEFVQRDNRVRLVQNEANIGAAPNFNKSFELSSGKYFKWFAHDDWIEPTYLEACVDVLEKQPDISICHTETRVYTEDEEFEYDYYDDFDGMNENKTKRFMSVVRDTPNVFTVFGIMRKDEMARTMLMGSNPGADRTFVAEMVLIGKVLLLPEHLYLNRSTRSARMYRDSRSWWDAEERKHHRPMFTLLYLHHITAIRRAKIRLRDKLRLTLGTTLYFLTCRRFIVFREMKHVVISRIPLSRGRDESDVPSAKTAQK